MNKAMTDILKNKRKTVLFVFLAIILVLATWYKLKVRGITMTEDASYEQVLVCKNSDVNHVHSAECYEKVAVTNQNEKENVVQEEKAKNTTDSKAEEQQTNKQNETSDQTSKTELKENTPETLNSEEIVKNADRNNRISTTALENVSHSEKSDAVNLYVNIDNNWTLIGVLSQKTGKKGKKYISADDVTKLINKKLDISPNKASEFNLCYFVGTKNIFSMTNINKDKYNLGNDNLYIDAYITSNVTSEDALRNGKNNFKVYSITEKTAENVPIDGTPNVYATTNKPATYQLSGEHNYYVNNESEIKQAGTQINISGPTVLKQVPVEKCTVTIVSVDGKVATKQVNKGSKFTLGSNLKWKVGDSTELTDGGTQITVNENITVTESNEIKINYTVDTSTTATNINAIYKYDGIAIPTVQGSNTYSTTITYNSGTTTEQLSDKYVTPYNSAATVTKDRIILEFAGWKINGGSTVVNAQTELSWNELYSYAQN